VIDHYVVRLHIAMHYTIRMAKLKSDQKLIDIVSVVNQTKENQLIVQRESVRVVKVHSR
jgi:hypothetical protein